LVFLEGLIPSIEIGYITKDELAIIRRMATAVVCMLDTVDDHILTKYAPNRTLNSRLEVIKYAGEGKVPVTTGILVGMGESLKSRKDAMEIIKHMHEKYGNIQNVVIQNYVPARGHLDIKQGPNHKEMLDTVIMARKILPQDVPITVPAVYNQEIMSFIKEGVRDIGLFDVTLDKTLDVDQDKLLATIEKQLKREGLGLQRRLPIFSKYIAENWYSRKLAQVLDKYKDMLKNAEGKSAAENKADAEEEDFLVKEEKPKKKALPKTVVTPKKVPTKAKPKKK
jgi:FO synthase subunit 1